MRKDRSCSRLFLFLCTACCLLFVLGSCNNEAPQINYGKDHCDFCKMTVMDKKFGAVVVNKKGKVLKFDSGECMVNYLKTDKDFTVANFLVISYETPGNLIDAEKAFYLYGGNVNSPMGGNLAAFETQEAAQKFQRQLNGELILWNAVVEINF